MRAYLIYPKWTKLDRQTPFRLPPHGPMVVAAAMPPDVAVDFTDENVDVIDFDRSTDCVCLSVMLTAQLPRAFEIADAFRSRGRAVLFGGIATMLHSEEIARRGYPVFLGEAEGRLEQVFADLRSGQLQARYDFMDRQPPIEQVGPARRDILRRELYAYRGVQMVDPVHASRGCRFNCFPCCCGFLGGRVFRPRPIERVIDEIEGIPNNRLFLVDNSLAQDRDWVKELFTAMKPLRRKWVSHPLLYEPEIVRLAAEAGCWYVYQAVFDTSDVIRQRIRMLKDHGIGVEGTIILGTDDQDVSYIKRLIDFLMEEEMDVAEFTILTPFPHSPVRRQLEQEGRILSNDWSRYTADKVVFRPKRMTPEELQEVYYYAWDTFYADGGYQLKMGELLRRVIGREMDDGTHRRFGRPVRRDWAAATDGTSVQ